MGIHLPSLKELTDNRGKRLSCAHNHTTYQKTCGIQSPSSSSRCPGRGSLWMPGCPVEMRWVENGACRWVFMPQESNLLSLLLIRGKTHTRNWDSLLWGGIPATPGCRLLYPEISNSQEQQRRGIPLYTGNITADPFVRGASWHQANWWCLTCL